MTGSDSEAPGHSGREAKPRECRDVPSHNEIDRTTAVALRNPPQAEEMEMRNAYQNMIRPQPQYVLPFFGPLEVLSRN